MFSKLLSPWLRGQSWLDALSFAPCCRASSDLQRRQNSWSSIVMSLIRRCVRWRIVSWPLWSDWLVFEAMMSSIWPSCYLLLPPHAALSLKSPASPLAASLSSMKHFDEDCSSFDESPTESTATANSTVMAMMIGLCCWWLMLWSIVGGSSRRFACWWSRVDYDEISAALVWLGLTLSKFFALESSQLL